MEVHSGDAMEDSVTVVDTTGDQSMYQRLSVFDRQWSSYFPHLKYLPETDCCDASDAWRKDQIRVDQFAEAF